MELIIKPAAVVLAAVLLVGAGAAQAEIVDVTGTVNWQEAELLPEDARLAVRLLDVSGEEPLSLAAITMRPSERPPHRFRLAYDSAIVRRGSYRLVAEVTVGPHEYMRSLRAVPFYGPGAGAEPEILIERVALPSIESGASPIGPTWQATEVLGERVPGHTRVTILLDENRTVSGSAGCNRFDGSYEMTLQVLTFGRMATTKRGCTSSIMRVERLVLRALDDVRGWTFSEGKLNLTDAAGQVLITLAEGR